jgi:alkylation response protein AidB-like acyl-CoA dehydrogenase
MVRCSARGYGDGTPLCQYCMSNTDTIATLGLLGGKVIGLPPVLNFGSEELKAQIVPDILAGKKFICLAISEAYAGSDVMGMQTTAVKSEDGKEWVINGSKKWITNGT